MKLKVAEYNERPIGLRVAHIDFFMLPTGEIMCTPYTKEETIFADSLVFAVNRCDELQIENVKLKTELAALKEAHKKSADEVMNIIGDALSGYCDRYINYDQSGKRYCKWGIVEKDIRSLFELPQSPEVE